MVDEPVVPPPAIRSEFLGVFNAPEPLVFILRGHQIIDTLLGDTLIEVLPNSEVIEIKRLSFPLKVDLCFALQAIRPPLRGAYAVFNRIRNHHAHEYHAAVAPQDVLDLRNSIPAETRRGFGIEPLTEDEAIFRKCVALLYLTSELALEALRDHKAEAAEWHAMAEEHLVPADESQWPPEVLEQHTIRKQRVTEAALAARRKRREEGSV
jgi:hypothetical protein